MLAVFGRKAWQRIRTTVLLSTAALVGLESANTSSGAAVNASSPAKAPGDFPSDVFRNGEAGFVVTEISYALGPDAESGACPTGMNGGVRALVSTLGKTPAGQRRPDETADAYERRMLASVHTANGQNTCLHPELAATDPGWRMVSGHNLKVGGINLDGQTSAAGKRPAAGTCAHDDFQGTQSETGIDNQFYRMIGCTAGFQSNGQANLWQTEMYTGSWGVLISLKGVDDLRNDGDVQVGIYANADPLQLSPARAALAYATYAIEQGPRYRATTRGRIVNGVLTTNPVDVRLIKVTNSMKDDRVLRDARLRLTFTADGGMEGYLAGYTPVEAMYNLQFGARASRNAKGELAPERMRIHTSVGRAGAMGYSCQGAYQALRAAADGHRDPATQRCTSISTQYRIRTTPAFIVEAPTQSINDRLAK